MDADDVKNRFHDILPPGSANKPTELNMQSRKMMVNDPMLTQPNPTNESETNPDTEDATEPAFKGNNYKIPEPVKEPADENAEPTEAPKLETSESPTIAEAEAEATPITATTEPAVAPEQPKPYEEPVATTETAESNVPASQPEANPASETTPATEEPVTSSFTSVDGLPDSSTQDVNAVKDGMQEPKIYDTSVYHVPIKETVHGHGAVKSALIFGAIFAIVVVGAVVFILFKFS